MTLMEAPWGDVWVGLDGWWIRVHSWVIDVDGVGLTEERNCSCVGFR